MLNVLTFKNVNSSRECERVAEMNLDRISDILGHVCQVSQLISMLNIIENY